MELNKKLVHVKADFGVRIRLKKKQENVGILVRQIFEARKKIVDNHHLGFVGYRPVDKRKLLEENDKVERPGSIRAINNRLKRVEDNVQVVLDKRLNERVNIGNVVLAVKEE